MKRDDILAALPKLSREDLATVYNMASHLLGVLSPTEGPKGKGASLVAQTLWGALTAALGQPKTPFSGYPAQQFEKRLPGLLEFLNTCFPGWDKKKVSQIAFTDMLFGLLISDLKSRDIKTSLLIVINNLGRLRSVVEASFPDYLESGMGDMILKRFQ